MLRKFLLSIAFSSFLAGVALAGSPVNTVLRSSGASKLDDTMSREILKAFRECNAPEALPQYVFADHGVRYIGTQEKRALRFSYAGLFKDRQQLVLLGNDIGSLETVADGAYLTYGGKYALRPAIDMLGVRIKSVTNMVRVGPESLESSVGLTTSRGVDELIALLDRESSGAVSARLNPSESELAKLGIWYAVSADGKTLRCWKRAR